MNNNGFQRILAVIMPFVGMGIFVVLFIVGLIFFSYLLIIAAIIGLVLFAIGYVRVKLFQRKSRTAANDQTYQSSGKGRVIEHDDD